MKKIVIFNFKTVINSKRPGLTESPFAVGKGVYQLETGFFIQKREDNDLYSLQNTKGADLFLRAGLFHEKFEMNVNLKLKQDEILNQLEPRETSIYSGLSHFTIGAKYLIYMPTFKDPSKEIRSWKAKTRYDFHRFIPSIGLYAGLNTNVVSQDFKQVQMSPRAALLLQNDFTDYIVWVNNIYADDISIENSRKYGYISTLIFSLNDRLSFFLENEGTLFTGIDKYKLGAGVAYLVGKNWQVDISAKVPLFEEVSDVYGSAGFSWRWDRHVDNPEKRVKRVKDGSGKLQNKRKGFFKRIFNR